MSATTTPSIESAEAELRAALRAAGVDIDRILDPNRVRFVEAYEEMTCAMRLLDECRGEPDFDEIYAAASADLVWYAGELVKAAAPRQNA